MRPPRPRFTVRRMMAVVAAMAVVALVGRWWWEGYLERERARARVLGRQQLLRRIGPQRNFLGR